MNFCDPGTPSRPIGQYAQLRFTKVVDGVLHVTARWVPASLLKKPGPYSFRNYRTGKWDGGWTFVGEPVAVVRPRVHSSWDDCRAAGEAAGPAPERAESIIY